MPRPIHRPQTPMVGPLSSGDMLLRWQLRIPAKSSTIPEGSRTAFRDDSEHHAERSDAGFLIVWEVFGLANENRSGAKRRQAATSWERGAGKGTAVPFPARHWRDPASVSRRPYAPAPRFLRIESPFISMRWALRTRRSRMPSATVGSPICSCQRAPQAVARSGSSTGLSVAVREQPLLGATGRAPPGDRLSLFGDDRRTVLAVKGSLRRTQRRRALDRSGPFVTHSL